MSMEKKFLHFATLQHPRVRGHSFEPVVAVERKFFDAKRFARNIAKHAEAFARDTALLVRDLAFELPKLRNFPWILLGSVILLVVGLIMVGVCDAYPPVSVFFVALFTVIKLVLRAIIEFIDLVFGAVTSVFRAACSGMHIPPPVNVNLGGPFCVLARIMPHISLSDIEGKLDSIERVFQYPCGGSTYHRYLTYPLLLVQRYTAPTANRIRSDVSGNSGGWAAHLVPHLLAVVAAVALIYYLVHRRPPRKRTHRLARRVAHMCLALAEHPANPKRLSRDTADAVAAHGFFPRRVDPWYAMRWVVAIALFGAFVGAYFLLHWTLLGPAWIIEALLSPFTGPDHVSMACFIICIGYFIVTLAAWLPILWLLYTFHGAIANLLKMAYGLVMITINVFRELYLFLLHPILLLLWNVFFFCCKTRYRTVYEK